MIQFLAKMYNETAQEYEDDSFIMYTIAQYTEAWSQYENPFINHEGDTLTNIPATAFAYGSNNIGIAFEYFAKKYYYEHAVWPVLKLCTSDSTTSYYIRWDHNNPNTFSINGGSATTAWQSVLQWDDSIDTSQEAPRFNTVRSYVFVTAGSSEQLDDELVFAGAVRINKEPVETLIAYNGFTLTYPEGALVHDQGTALFKNANNGNITKLYTGDALSIMYTNGVDCRYWLIAPKIGASYAAPWNGQASYRYSLSEQTVQIGAVKIVLNGNGFPAAGRQLLVGITINELPTTNEGYLAAAGIEVAYNKNNLKDYLNPPTPPTPPSPEPPSDVDPTDIPPEDDPPVPIPPDDQDPYYDPTSDPRDPTYDPTKDPKDPTYDPTTPHTPYRPPSDVDGGGPAPVQPIPGVIDIPTAPPAFVTNNSLFTLYNPSGGDLNNLANFLWSPTWSLDTLKKIFVNPMDCILGLMVMPQLPADVSSKEMNFGNVPTGITMHFFTKQFCDFDCGTFKLEEFYMSYLDYAPYTKVSIFLPYIGEVELSTDEVMNKTIGVKYRFDISCGACVAFITVDGSTLYSFSGNCAAHLPLSANDWGSTVTALAAVPLGAAKIGAMIGGGPIGALGAAAAISVMSMKEKVTHAGTLKGSAGLMGIQTPYLIVNRPRQAAPLNQNAYTGYPSFITESLGSLHGYTEVEQCHLDHVPATHEELVEIERLLKEGVML